MALSSIRKSSLALLALCLNKTTTAMHITTYTDSSARGEIQKDSVAVIVECGDSIEPTILRSTYTSRFYENSFTLQNVHEVEIAEACQISAKYRVMGHGVDIG